MKKEIGSDIDYFSVNIQLGVSLLSGMIQATEIFVNQAGGIEKILPIGEIDDYEKTLLGAAVKELGPSIEKVCRSR